MLPLPLLMEFKNFYATLWVMTYFPLYNPFPTKETSQASCSSRAISKENILTSYILLLPKF